jgi:predicted DNA-binding protein YlxM (UPF0122 family)
MFEKNLKIGYLLDFYGEALPDRTRDVLDGYYGEDLSLGELAEALGISRQGVRHVIKKGEEELLRMESSLHLAEKFADLRTGADRLRSLADTLDAGDPEAAHLLANEARTLAELILQKGF